MTPSDRKRYMETTVSPSGLYMQLGLELSVSGSPAPTEHVMAELRFPMAAG